MSNAVAQIQPKASIIAKLAQRFAIDQDKLVPILKATAFKVRDGVISNEQMTALMVVADQYGLNPFTKELYAYPDKGGGIVPVVSVDGWSRIINENPALNGIEFRYSDQTKTMPKAKECPVWCEVIIYRKDRAQPTVVREYLDETFRDLNYANPWQTHTKRMLRHKALIQGARIAFGFGGIYDEDEAQRVMELDVTPITPTAGALSALPVKSQQVVIETANEVKRLLKEDNVMDAYAMWQDSRFDADHHVAFWSLLDSKQRGVLSRMSDAERAAERGTEAVIIEQQPAEALAAPDKADTITHAQHKRLEARIKELGADRDKLKAYVIKEYGIEHLNALTKEAYKAVDAMLDKKAAAAASVAASLADRIKSCKTAEELDALAETFSEEDVGIYFDAVAKRKSELQEAAL